MNNDYVVLFQCISILAFILTFYGHVAREQRLPCIINSMYSLVALFLLFGASITVWLFLRQDGFLSESSAIGRFFSSNYIPALVSVLMIGCAWFMLKDYHRLFALRDYGLSSKMITVLFKKTTYKDNDNEFFSPEFVSKLCESNDIFGDKQQEIADILKRRKITERLGTDSISIVNEVANRFKLDEKLVKISSIFLQNGYNLQYLSCTRHPVEFLKKLHHHWEEIGYKGAWENVRKQIVLVDAHTKHFGFDEAIYRHVTARTERDDRVKVITASFSYAGIHSALIKGYEQILNKGSERSNKPTLLIYDCCSSLIDLESERLFRIFIKHVVPSERLMGGNFSLFVEQYIARENIPFFNEVFDLVITGEQTSLSQLEASA